jgi:hypothetical protein
LEKSFPQKTGQATAIRANHDILKAQDIHRQPDACGNKEQRNKDRDGDRKDRV